MKKRIINYRLKIDGLLEKSDKISKRSGEENTHTGNT